MDTTEGFPASQYITNIGLALKEVLASEKGALAYSLVNFNALPEAYLSKPRPISEILFVPVIIAGIALLTLGAYANITASALTTDLRANLAAINQIAISAQAQTKDIIALTEEASSLEATAAAFATMLEDFSAGRNEINGDLAMINKAFGQKALKLDIDHRGDTITVKGLLDNKDAVFTCAEDLRATGRFALVVITDMHQEGQQIRFSLTLTK